MKKIMGTLLGILLLMLASTVSVNSATKIQCGDNVYGILYDTGKLVIQGTGDMSDCKKDHDAVQHQVSRTPQPKNIGKVQMQDLACLNHQCLRQIAQGIQLKLIVVLLILLRRLLGIPGKAGIPVGIFLFVFLF